MLTLIKNIVKYLLKNPVELSICIAVAALFFIAVIALISISKKAKKRAKKLAKAAAKAAISEEAPAEEEAAIAEEAPAQEEVATAEEAPAQEKVAIAEDAPAQDAPAQEAPAEKITAAVVEKKKATTPKKSAPNAAKSALAATKKMGTSEEKPAPAQPAAEPQQAPTEKASPKSPSKTTEKTAVKAPAEKGARYTGKWVICKLILTDSGDQTIDETYFFELRASNGELLLASEEYTSHAGALKGIQTHKDNVEKGNFRITVSKKGDYIFKLLNAKNTLLCTGANYKSLERCESAVASTKRFASTAILQEETEEVRIKQSADDDSPAPEIPDNGYTGKWIISSKGDEAVGTMYYFELFASNGEKLLTSEEYTTYEGAVNAVDTHKTNIAKGNFRISVTKRGDYIFKLLGGNGQLLCLGEHYKTRSRCESAVESVKRFSASAPVLKYGEIK